MKLTHLIFPLAAVGILSLQSCSNADKQAETVPQDELILHAWSWSFDTIAANMRQIAEAGYDYVQTSPAQACFVGDDGGMALYSEEGDSVMGKWYYYYQPTDWTVGNYMLGDRDAFKAMCDSARAYGVRVIVDVLPNHTAVDHTAVLPGLDNAVGGHENLFHANGFTDITDYNDRLQCTTGKMGGLPDVNTENPDFQEYYMRYVNDLIALGARGFRYDTAKHIGLPSDPLDPKAEQNDFWDIFLGHKDIRGTMLSMPDSLFIYGEVLQDRNVKEDEYAEIMCVTASNYGHELRKALAEHNAKAADIASWHHSADSTRLVTWVESHDTYCNQHESADLTDEAIRTGWAFLTARQGGRPLFFSRPAGSTRENYWGNNRIGARGNDEFFHPEVVAVNEFRHRMSGQPETLVFAEDGSIAEVSRGNAGAAIINFTPEETSATLATNLPDGEYKDVVYNNIFTVADGVLTGKLAPQTSYIIYNYTD